jgi:hypothetical protein
VSEVIGPLDLSRMPYRWSYTPNLPLANSEKTRPGSHSGPVAKIKERTVGFERGFSEARDVYQHATEWPGRGGPEGIDFDVPVE